MVKLLFDTIHLGMQAAVSAYLAAPRLPLNADRFFPDNDEMQGEQTAKARGASDLSDLNDFSQLRESHLFDHLIRLGMGLTRQAAATHQPYQRTMQSYRESVRESNLIDNPKS